MKQHSYSTFVSQPLVGTSMGSEVNFKVLQCMSSQKILPYQCTYFHEHTDVESYCTCADRGVNGLKGYMIIRMDTESSLPSGEGGDGGGGGDADASACALSAAERARAERQRLRARELRAARLAHTDRATETSAGGGGGKEVDTGGGFLLPASAPPATPQLAPVPPAPPPARRDWPACAECGARFPQSTLLLQFALSVCDACHDPDDKHALVTRTEAKSEFLLKDCDLDSRQPPLRCVRRRNPHRERAHDMRLYVRAQVHERALLVWGGEHALAAERARREERRATARATKYGRELRALRRTVRPAPPAPGKHDHQWAAERATAEEDVFERTCTECGLVQTFEKM